MWRATNDVDLVIDLREDQVSDFVQEFQHDFYVAEERRSFHLIHLGSFYSFYKFDLFPLEPDQFQRQQFSRRRYESAAVFGETKIEFAVATAEDVVLSKLRWYRDGGEVSEQQWNDILGVLAQQRGKLDLAYLREWAPVAGVADLLEKALVERHSE